MDGLPVIQSCVMMGNVGEIPGHRVPDSVKFRLWDISLDRGRRGRVRRRGLRRPSLSCSCCSGTSRP